MVAHIHHAKKHRHTIPVHVTQFIQKNLVAVSNVSRKYGVPASIILAQAGLESGWGQKVEGNAYFGVKGKAPDGASVNIATHEDTKEGHIAIHDNFRAYTSFEDAAEDYAMMLSSNPRFSHAFMFKNDPEKFAEELQRNHYATDVNYAKKIKQVIKSFSLRQYDNP